MFVKCFKSIIAQLNLFFWKIGTNFTKKLGKNRQDIFWETSFIQTILPCDPVLKAHGTTQSTAS